MNWANWTVGAIIAIALTGCLTERNFREDFEFLKHYTDAMLLEDGNAMLIVVPAYQGRVMTSTFNGMEGTSLGWVNYDLIESQQIQPHINVFGGEDRLWLGPEGGQFAIFFKQGDEFTLNDWQTPPLIDTVPFPVKEAGPKEVTFSKEASLVNYSGTHFDLRLDRTVRMLDQNDVERHLGASLGSQVQMVAYETENTLTNTGDAAWTKEGGALSIWILGMYKPAAAMTVVVPFRSDIEGGSGPVVNDAYFGPVPGHRLKATIDTLFFSGDGQYRSKIGVSPARAKPVLASYDPGKRILTLVHYNQPEGVTDYVNSMWELQDQPFAGDVVNSYNDGAPAPGAEPLGPFYELETSSPAALLDPGESLTHIHRTVHLTGSKIELDKITRAVLNLDLAAIEATLSAPK